MQKISIKYFVILIFLVLILFSCYQDNDAMPEAEQEVWDIEDIEIEDSEAFRNTITEALAENAEIHEDNGDYTWADSDEVKIIFNGNSITVNDSGATPNGSTVTITAGGNYNLSGTLNDGQIIVNSTDDEIVRLILNGVTINNSSSAPIFIKEAHKTLIYLADGKENYVEDASEYIFEDTEDDEPNASIFSKDDLSISGPGTLTIKANYNDGITGKDGLIIKNGKINIDAKDDGIRGKDFLIIHDGDFIISASGDGLKSDNDEDETKGFIYIEKGSFDISCQNDAIQAKTDLLIEDGTFLLSAGSEGIGTVDESVKGMKASVNLILDEGIYNISATDDAIHSNGSLVINEGIYELSTEDDAIHADGIIYVNNGEINITKAYEGIESTVIKINDGDIHIQCSDDGINIAGGNDGSGHGGPGFGGGFQVSSDYQLFISGGRIAVYSKGDGIDSNGYITMEDGTIVIHGPTSDMNSAIDYDGGFTISGGFLVGVGSARMAQGPGSSSSQSSMLIDFTGTIPGGTMLHIESDNGTSVLNFTPEKNYQSLVFSSPDLSAGTTYLMYYEGTCSGSESDGLYTGGVYSSGTELGSITLN